MELGVVAPPAGRGWERLVLAGGLLAAFVLCLGPIFNPDIPWHLAAARRIVETRSIPRADFLSWTKAGRPWIDFEWGAQLIFYGLERTGGVAALWLFKASAFFCLGLILAALLRLWKLPIFWVALAVPVFIRALLPSIDIRPELFSLLLFSIQFYALEKKRLGLLRAPDKAVLAAQVALYSLWANLHAGFPMGLVLCALYGAAEYVRPDGRGSRASALAWAAAGLLGTVINPYGVWLYSMLWDHVRQMSVLHHLIIEWGEPNFVNAFEYGYWAMILFSYAGFILSWARRRSLPLEHFFTIIAFSLFAARFFRTTSYATLVLFPFSLLAWYGLPSPTWWRRSRPWILGICLGIGAWNAAKLLREEGFPRISIIGDQSPAGAFGFMRDQKNVLGGLNLYNSLNWGDLIDYLLYPDYKVFMDGRYIFTDMLVEADIAKRSPTRWRMMMDQRGVDLALIENNGHRARLGTVATWRAYEALGMPRSDWALVYWDYSAMVVVRRSKVPADWLKPHEFRFLWPRDLRHLGLLIMSGEVSLKDVSTEIDRYQREIGDPREVYLLRNWLKEFKKGQVSRS